MGINQIKLTGVAFRRASLKMVFPSPEVSPMLFLTTKASTSAQAQVSGAATGPNSSPSFSRPRLGPQRYSRVREVSLLLKVALKIKPEAFDIFVLHCKLTKGTIIINPAFQMLITEA